MAHQDAVFAITADAEKQRELATILNGTLGVVRRYGKNFRPGEIKGIVQAGIQRVGELCPTATEQQILRLFEANAPESDARYIN